MLNNLIIASINKCDCQNSFLLLLRGEFFLWQGDFILTYNFLNYSKSFKEFGKPTGKKALTIILPEMCF